MTPDRSWIVEALGDPAAYDRLASGLAGTALWSVLMEVARDRARARTPAEVLGQYRRDRFVRPAMVDQRTALAIDAELLAAAAGFEALELAPVTPLATCSSVAPTDQHRVLSALRGTEVVSDPTNVFALECADRLARAPAEPVRLTTSMRVVRAQAVPPRPGHAQHFRIFVLATGGRELPDHGFSVAALADHIRALLAGFDRLERIGYAFGVRRLDILTTGARVAIADRLETALAGAIPVGRDVLDHPYYSGGVRYRLWVTAPDGTEVALADGGTFDWLAKLTGNHRYAYVASGMGAQLVAVQFTARVAGGAAPGAGGG